MTKTELIASTDPSPFAVGEEMDCGLSGESPLWSDPLGHSGSPIHAPHVNTSRAETHRVTGGPEGEIIALGLDAVRGLSSSTMIRILSLRRKSGIFVSISDVLARLRPEKREARLLVRSGCLDHLPAFEGGIPLTRPQALWLMHHLMREGSCSPPFFTECVPELPRFIGDYRIEARREDGFTYLGIDLFPSFVDSSGAS